MASNFIMDRLAEAARTSYVVREIMEIVKNCEEIQKSDVCEDVKQKEKIHAYNDIRDYLMND